jgi:hypothetical protein
MNTLDQMRPNGIATRIGIKVMMYLNLDNNPKYLTTNHEYLTTNLRCHNLRSKQTPTVDILKGNQSPTKCTSQRSTNNHKSKRQVDFSYNNQKLASEYEKKRNLKIDVKGCEKVVTLIEYSLLVCTPSVLRFKV